MSRPKDLARPSNSFFPSSSAPTIPRLVHTSLPALAVRPTDNIAVCPHEAIVQWIPLRGVTGTGAGGKPWELHWLAACAECCRTPIDTVEWRVAQLAEQPILDLDVARH